MEGNGEVIDIDKSTATLDPENLTGWGLSIPGKDRLLYRPRERKSLLGLDVLAKTTRAGSNEDGAFKIPRERVASVAATLNEEEMMSGQSEVDEAENNVKKNQRNFTGRRYRTEREERSRRESSRGHDRNSTVRYGRKRSRQEESRGTPGRFDFDDGRWEWEDTPGRESRSGSSKRHQPSPSPLFVGASPDAWLVSPWLGGQTPTGSSASPWDSVAPLPTLIRASGSSVLSSSYRNRRKSEFDDEDERKVILLVHDTDRQNKERERRKRAKEQQQVSMAGMKRGSSSYLRPKRFGL